MGDATIFGVPNHGLNPANTWTGGNTVSGYPVSNCARASLSDQTLLYPTLTNSWIKLAIATGEWRQVGGVGLMHTNVWKGVEREPDTGAINPLLTKWRVRLAQADFHPLRNPDAIAASSNLTGAVAAVQDDPDLPDSSWLTATTPGTATNARFTFPTLGGLNLVTSGSIQVFRLRVRKTTAGTGNPVLTVELYEGGTLKATLSPSKTTDFTSVATGDLVTATFSAASLSDATGANVEVRLSGTGVTGTSLEYGAVLLVSEHNFTVAGAHDSGLMTVYLPNTIGVLPLNLYYVLPSTMTPDFVRFDINDTTNPDGYIQIGLPVIGPRFTFGVNNVTPGAEWTLDDESVKGRTKGGATRADLGKKRRGFNGTWDNLTDTQAYETFFDKLLMQCGTTGGFVFIFDPDTTSRYPHTAAYATLNGQQKVVHQHADGSCTYAISMSEEVASPL